MVVEEEKWQPVIDATWENRTVEDYEATSSTGVAEKPHKPKGLKIRSRAEKEANQPIVRAEAYSASFGAFLLKNHTTFPIQEPRKICEKQEVL